MAILAGLGSLWVAIRVQRRNDALEKLTRDQASALNAFEDVSAEFELEQTLRSGEAPTAVFPLVRRDAKGVVRMLTGRLPPRGGG